LVFATCEVMVQVEAEAAVQAGDNVIENIHDCPGAMVSLGDSVTAPPAPNVPVGKVVIAQPPPGAGIVTLRTTRDVWPSPASAFTWQLIVRVPPRATLNGLAGEQVMLM